MLQCLTGAVGLTRDVNNPCYSNSLTTEQKARLSTSSSGLYLDEVEGGLTWQAINSSRGGSDSVAEKYYKIVTQAQDNAIMSQEADLIQALFQRYQKGKKGFVGTLGQKQYTASGTNLQHWQGIRIKPNDGTEAMQTIKRITAAFNATGFITYYLLRVPKDGTVGEVVQTWENNTIMANQWSEATAFIPQPQLFVVNNQVNDYYIVYDRTQLGPTGQPKNNPMVCDCSGAESQKPGQFARVEGVSFDAVVQDNQFTLSNIQADNTGHGLLIEIEISCESSTLFCKEYQNNEAIKVTMNWMLLYKMQYHLIKAVLNSNETSRYTTMDKDNMLRNLGIFKNNYEKRIPYVIETININEAGGCFTCGERTNHPVKRTIYL